MKVSIKENLVVRKNGVGNLLLNFLSGWFGLCPMTNKNNYVNDTDFSPGMFIQIYTENNIANRLFR